MAALAGVYEHYSVFAHAFLWPSLPPPGCYRLVRSRRCILTDVRRHGGSFSAGLSQLDVRFQQPPWAPGSTAFADSGTSQYPLASSVSVVVVRRPVLDIHAHELARLFVPSSGKSACGRLIVDAGSASSVAVPSYHASMPLLAATMSCWRRAAASATSTDVTITAARIVGTHWSGIRLLTLTLRYQVAAPSMAPFIKCSHSGSRIQIQV
jgi:hypothetical protein